MPKKDIILDQVVDTLRNRGDEYFPEHSGVKSVRSVGHTPKPDHYIYEIVLDFANATERVNAKVYRAGKGTGRSSAELARNEAQSLKFAYAAAEERGPAGIPRPVGDFTELGAVVSTKINGLPLQSIIMKTALLPDFGSGDEGLLVNAARQSGEWLRQFHQATAGGSSPLDADRLASEIERLCSRAQKNGLPAESTEIILSNAQSALSRQKEVRSSAVLNDFVPLNILVGESGVGFCEFAHLVQSGNSLDDAAMFLAAVEALEKYPFCNRSITTRVQDAFLEACGVSRQEEELLAVLKMKVLLQMFAQGRTGKESAERKKVMWANVMKRFIQQAAERSMVPAA